LQLAENKAGDREREREREEREEEGVGMEGVRKGRV